MSQAPLLKDNMAGNSKRKKTKKGKVIKRKKDRRLKKAIKYGDSVKSIVSISESVSET